MLQLTSHHQLAELAALIHTGAASHRLRLRPLQRHDQQLFVALYTDARVMAYTGLQADANTVAGWFTYALRETADKQLFYWRIEPKGLSAAVGLVALRLLQPARQQNSGAGSAELGILLSPPYWRQGYAKQALTLLRDSCFATGAVACLSLQHQPANLAMAMLAAGCGFICKSQGAIWQWQQLVVDWQQGRQHTQQGMA